MALQWRQPPNALKAAKTLGETLITLALNYASPKNSSLAMHSSFPGKLEQRTSKNRVVK